MNIEDKQLQIPLLRRCLQAIGVKPNEFDKKNLKETASIATVVGSIATAIAAIFTAYFGFQIYKLNQIDLGPTVYPSNVEWEISNAELNLPMSRGDLYSDGEIFDQNLVSNKVALSVKFKNIGRLPAKLTLISVNTDNGGTLQRYKTNGVDADGFLLPGGAESQYLYTIDIYNKNNQEILKKQINYNYKIQYENIQSKVVEYLNFSVHCQSKENIEKKIFLYCFLMS